MNNNVIIALATPPLKSALALIRLSGEGVFELTDQIFSRKTSDTKGRTIYFGTLKDEGEEIDQVCVYAYKGPHTMTGEDVVEITCHGSMVIVNQIVEAYLKRGARYAERGEFTSRAFFNGKMDLVEAESVNDMIKARSKEAKNVSLMSLEGKTSKLVAPLKKKIADLLALIEVNIDYPEYTDIEEANKETIVKSVEDIHAFLKDLIHSGEEGKIIKDGVKVAIVGEPNVGKSSLLNALLDEDKAIVSPIPGTTRDIVEGEINLKGVIFHLLDTAGIHESSDYIESKGIEKSEKSISEADMVILVVDAQKGFSEADKKIISSVQKQNLIIAYNKMDLLSEKKGDVLYISAQNKQIQPLLDKMFESLGITDEDAFSKPSLNSARQLGLLKRIDELLALAKKDAENDAPIDFVSSSLEGAYNLARELLGEGVTTDLTDEIFSRFCVGK